MNKHSSSFNFLSVGVLLATLSGAAGGNDEEDEPNIVAVAADDFGCADLGEKEGPSVSDLLLDGIHLHETGHRLIADPLIEQLTSAGSALQPERPDLAFAAVTATERPVQRPIAEQTPRPHTEQWQRSQESQLISDMARCTPARVLSHRRQHDTWKVFEYP